MKALAYVALIGDGLYILWILYNAIDSGFSEINSIQVVVPLGLLVLLVVNILLIVWRA